jgi:ABC-type uncharacterized transport system involved in gliding motility auxiliary subunit
MDIKKLFQQQSVRYGGYASLMTIVVIAAVIVLNLIVSSLSSAQIDMTENRIFSISDQTRNIVDNLENDVTLYAVYRQGAERDQVLEILRRFESLSGNISLQVVDPDQNPAFAQRYAEEGKQVSNGSVVVVSEQTSRIIPPNELFSVDRRNPRNPRVIGINVERRITNALAYMQTGNIPVIYQLTGHNEYTLSGLNLQQTIERENYRVESLNLVTEPAVPDDAAIVLIMGPESDITDPEANKLQSYLDNGGSAFVAVDFSAGPTPVLNGLMETYGLQFRRGVVIEGSQSNHMSGQPLFLVPNMQEHPTLEPIRSEQLLTVLPATQPLQTVEVRRRNLGVTPLFRTSSSAFLREDLENATMQQQPDDPTGPFTVGAAVEDEFATQDDPGVRMVALGSAGFLTRMGNLGVPRGNVEFFRNSLAWLQNQQDLISAGTKSLMQFPLQLTGTLTLLYAGIVVILIPLAIFAIGLVVYLRRRHL